MSRPYQGTTKASVSGNEPLQRLAEACGDCGPAELRLDVGSALAPEALPPSGVLEDQVQRLGELVEVLEGEAATGADDVVRGHRAASVDEDRRPREPGLHQDDREGFVD